jgi:60 kDa SS-A/Ro ribonucleoprotein
MSAASQRVIQKLQDRDLLQKARIHPVNILVAMKTYASGHGMRGSLSWNTDHRIVDALDDAFYAAFDYVEPTNKRFLLALDVSGSMNWQVEKAGNLTARELAAAMAMTTVKTENIYHTVAFTTGGFRNTTGGGWRLSGDIRAFPLSSRQRLDDVVNLTDNLPFSGTDCALPMLYAKHNNLAVDVFIVYTDNETWAGDIHPFQALKDYRQTTGINAKLIVAAFTSTGFSIADPNDPGMLDVVGFDSAIPTLIRDFSEGQS